MTATLHEVRFLAGRSLRHIPRISEKAFGAVLLPLVFVLLFAYVFGSAIEVPGGGDYHTYLVSGIFAQTNMPAWSLLKAHFSSSSSSKAFPLRSR